MILRIVNSSWASPSERDAVAFGLLKFTSLDKLKSSVRNCNLFVRVIGYRDSNESRMYSGFIRATILLEESRE